ncbi:MAG: hypothetical protein WC700_07990 [Gemmatimonadaceae bacterium]|jgi:hypothetical protein
MKRLLLVLPFLLAACDSGVSVPTETAVLKSSSLAANGGSCTLANGSTANTGFDQWGYNRCAHIFNGTWEGYCTEPKRHAVPDCYGVSRTTKLVMKWNEEWDRGNAEKWLVPPYAAWLDNEARGTYVDGTPYSEHFKTKWDAGCAASHGAVSSNGGSCIWGPFEILMDQGTEAGEHFWWTKLTPAGYGN